MEGLFIQLMIIKKIDISRRLLFDGKEDQLFEEELNVEIDNRIIKFIPDDITPNKFDQLDKQQEIINQSHFVRDNIYNAWKSEEGLTLYYYKTDDYLLIFSMGEFQPARYKLYLESAWNL